MRGVLLAWLGCISGAFLGCAGGTEPHQGDVGVTGSIAMPLVTQANGVTYRLRNATFTITGPTAFQVLSDSDPDAVALTAVVEVGTYSIRLEEGWFLERVDASGPVTVEAAILSDNPTPQFPVVANVTNVAGFLFGIASGSVSFQGTLSIEIEVAPPCDLVTQSGCSTAQACYPSPSTPPVAVCASTTLATMGLGEACTYLNACMPGLTCRDAVCRAICDRGSSAPCSSGGVCTSLGIANAGVCLPL